MVSKSKRRRKSSGRTVSKPILDYSTSLERAHRALEQNQADSAKYYAEKALEFINRERNPKAEAAVQPFLAEAHFRLAAAAPLPQEQERHLDIALSYFPQEARFHFHRAIALFRQTRLADAAAALEKAKGHPGAPFVAALLAIVTAQAWDERGLTPEEANTLRLLAARHQESPASALHVLAQAPLLASNPVWQALIDLDADPTTVPSEHLQNLAGSLTSDLAQGILYYYAGVAALSQGERKGAADAWSISAVSGWRTPWQTENHEYLGREDVIALAQEEKWQEIVNLAEEMSTSVSDRILSETIGAAYFHLGYQAAEAAQWSKAADLLRAAGKYAGGRILAQNLAICEEALGRWTYAGDAWREMARRRPRSEKHPDYMTDAQVAALWVHAAECYDKSEYVEEEVVTCLRNAVKYAENDVEVRTKLVEALLQDDRDDAAEAELERILEIDEQHIPTLLRLAEIHADRWDGNPVFYFRRVLALEPDNQEARDGLAEHYLDQVMHGSASLNLFGRLMGREREPIKLLKEALKDLPGHQRILLALGVKYREADKKKEAQAALEEAYQADPRHVETAGVVMHELLHLNKTADVEKMVAEVNQISGLLMGFWISQGGQALACKLDTDWAARFFDEALLLSDKKQGNDSRPVALVQILDSTFENNADALTERYLNRVRDEMPDSGILEYWESRVSYRKKDVKKAQRLLRKARQMAQKLNNPELIREMDALENLFSGRRNPFLDILRDLGGDGDFDFF